VEEIGRNSVRPSTTPMMAALINNAKSMNQTPQGAVRKE
jgi:hypothetical protein